MNINSLLKLAHQQALILFDFNKLQRPQCLTMWQLTRCATDSKCKKYIHTFN